ncbi:MAG: DUF4249 family protein [Porphyromonadaceae bacterium]|nr:MAG: DUF4249 family protein [Porphyromonadaceae bacterium]
MSSYHKIKHLIVLVILTESLACCTEEFEKNAPGNPVPVVYCLLNPSDTINYVRLTKSFIGTESASILARDPSQLYFKNAEVYLEIISESGWPIKYAPFTKIVGPAKEFGIFIESPNQLFSLNASMENYLSEGYTIRLIVNIPEIQAYCSANQIYHSAPQIILPRPSFQTKMNLYNGEPQQIKWEDKFGAATYQLSIQLNYTEVKDQDSITKSIQVSYNYQSKITKTDQNASTLVHILDGDSFLKNLAIKISKDLNVNYRIFNSFDIILISASESFKTYTESINLTADRTGLPISNMAGGTGLFSLTSKSVQSGYLLDKPSMDSLSSGRFTIQLKFIKW